MKRIFTTPAVRRGSRGGKKSVLPLAAAFGAAMLIAAPSCAMKGQPSHGSAVSLSSPAVSASSQQNASGPASSAAKSSVSFTASSSRAAASSLKTSPPGAAASAKPSGQAGGPVDLSDTAMLGNSFVQDIDALGLLPEMDCYYRIGLSVTTVFTKPMASGNIPVIDELKKKPYKAVYLLFGENELGWPYPGKFEEAYGSVIDAVRTRQPHAKIYIQSIFPLTAAASAQNADGANNQHVVEFNTLLRQLARQKGAVYLDVYSVLADGEGNLPAGSAPDGVHFTVKYDQLWVQYLKTHG